MSDNMDMPDATDEQLASLVQGPDFARTGEMEEKIASPGWEDEPKGKPDPLAFPGLDSPVLTIGRRTRAWVLIFGRRYFLRRPDEGAPADSNAAAQLGKRIGYLATKKQLTEADMQNLTSASRELMCILMPEMTEQTVKFLTLSEMAKISTAWENSYGSSREVTE